MKKIISYVEDEIKERLIAHCDKTGISFSKFMKRAVFEKLAKEESKVK